MRGCAFARFTKGVIVASQHRHLTEEQAAALIHVSVGQLIRLTEPIRLGKRLVKRLRAHLKICEFCREAIRNAAARPNKLPYRVACEVRVIFPDDGANDDIDGTSDIDDVNDDIFYRGEMPAPEESDS